MGVVEQARVRVGPALPHSLASLPVHGGIFYCLLQERAKLILVGRLLPIYNKNVSLRQGGGDESIFLFSFL